MNAPGLFVVRGFAANKTAEMIDEARAIAQAAPFRAPRMRNGQQLNLCVTSAGQWGWWADERGYRYVDKHPTTNKPWPAISPFLLGLFREAMTAVGLPIFEPDSLLLNLYPDRGSLGMHVDNTEETDEPIVSISFGADAIFAIGGHERTDPFESFVLSSGDLLVQSGEARSRFHGIKKILPTMTSPMPHGQRLNFTFRRAKRA